jgi:predicted transcriptional regulator
MQRVLQSVQDGSKTRQDIAKSTGLQHNQVRAALRNLAFIGAIKAQRYGQAWYYVIADANTVPKASKVLYGVCSIFKVGA